MSIRFVRQRTRWDCGIATAAMLCSLKYTEAYSLWKAIAGLPRLAAPGINTSTMLSMLTSVSGEWRACEEVSGPVAEWSMKGPMGAVLSWQGPGYFGHWMCYYHGILYDPHHDGPRLAKDSLRASHLVRAYLFPI